jgi:tetratricopeptide (TPR) repeat protein
MSNQFEQHCGNCGLPLAPGSTACPRCGVPVSTAPPSASQAPSGPPSEFFPNFQYDVNEAATIVHEGPFPGWEPASPLSGAPSGAFSSSQPASPGLAAQVPAGISGQVAPGTAEASSGGMTPPETTPTWSQGASSKGTPAPAFPGVPAQPGWPSGLLPSPGAVPGQTFPSGGMPTGVYAPGYDMQQGAMMMTPIPAAKPPLPRWFTAGAAALVALGVFLVWLTGSDWAEGGKRAGIAAFVAAAIVLGAFVYRYVTGYRATRAIGLAVASVLVLIILGGAGIGLQSTFHQLQGRSLESQQNFPAAINQFQLSGEKAPDGVDLARTYNDWGEQLKAQKNYQAAIDKFDTVLHNFPGIADEVARAQRDEANAYLAWGDQYFNQSDYQNAVDKYNKILGDQKTFGATPDYVKIHQQAAKAYFGLGKKLESDGDCTDAASTYNTLVKDFSDTPESQQAQTELKKPQDITGRVINVTTSQPAPNVRLFLSSRWQVQNGVFSASDDTSTTSDANGNFAFKNITPGNTKYLISYVGTDGRETITVSRASGQPQNVIQVAPICAPDPVTVLQF